MKRGEQRDARYEPGRTALLMIDMQRVWLEPGLDPANPGASADDYFYRHSRAVTIPNLARLLASARNADVEVLHTNIRSLTEDGRDRSLDHKLTPIHVARSAPEGANVSDLAPVGDEMVLSKTSSGVFNSTILDYLLRNMDIRYLLVGGIMTDQCVDMAIRDGADRGYLVTCITDACAAATPERHEQALRAFGGYCWLADTETVIARMNDMAAGIA